MGNFLKNLYSLDYDTVDVILMLSVKSVDIIKYLSVLQKCSIQSEHNRQILNTV